MTRKHQSHQSNRNWFTYSLVLILWLAYTFLTFQAPQANSNQQFNLTPTQLSLLKLTIVLPYLAIWFAAAFGLLRFKRYVSTIFESPDGHALSKIGTGLDLLVFGLIFSAVLGATRSFFLDAPNLLRTVAILINYSYVLIPLAAFWMLFSGSRDLLLQLKGVSISNTKKVILLTILGLLAIIYLWLIVTNTTVSATYYMPHILVLLTIGLPALVSWGLGLLSALHIQTYAEKVPGVIYRQALAKFVYGIYSVIAGSILLQALLSLGTQKLLGLGLAQILGIVYLFLIVQGLGFFLIAIGSNKLSKLETIS